MAAQAALLAPPRQADAAGRHSDPDMSGLEDDVKMPPPMPRNPPRHHQQPSPYDRGTREGSGGSLVPALFDNGMAAASDSDSETESESDDGIAGNPQDSTQQLREARAHQAAELAEALGASIERLKSLESQSDASGAYKEIKRVVEGVTQHSPTLRDNANTILTALDETTAFTIKTAEELLAKCGEGLERMRDALELVRTLKEQQEKERSDFLKAVASMRARHAREVDEIRKRMDQEQRSLTTEGKGYVSPKTAEDRLRNVMREFLDVF